MRGQQVHPHVADLAGNPPPGVNPTTPQTGPAAGTQIPDASPLLNYPNGTWDNGEGFPAQGTAQDTGGIFGLDDGSGVQDSHVHTNVPWTANQPIAGTQRFVGYLRDAQLPAGVDPDDAAFEIVAPLAFVSGPVYLMIQSHGTLGGGAPNSRGGGLGYPGSGAEGLVGPPFRPELVSTATGRGFNLITTHIEPRLAVRPLLFQMQRNLQLLAAIQRLFDPASTITQRPAGMPASVGPTDLRVLAGGGSFGGYVGPLMTLLYPNRVHGGYGSSMAMSIRRGTFGEQEMWRFIGAMTGFQPEADGKEYRLDDQIKWLPYLYQEGTDHFSTSMMRRHGNGDLPRPLYLINTDEDTTSCGTDWLPLIYGAREHRAWGVQPPLGTTYPQAELLWSTCDKRCHEVYVEFVKATDPWPNATPVLQTDIHEAIVEFLPKVEAAFLAGTVPVPPRKITETPQVPTSPTSEDGHDHALARGCGEFVAPAGPLVLDPAFGQAGTVKSSRPGKTHGHGTRLGFDESLVVHDGAIYVGSADGVVTRFVVDPTTLEVVATNRSEHALGYGAWGLAVGDVDPATAGDEIVVATHRGICVLRGDGMACGCHLEMGDAVTLPWEHTRPRRLQIADVFPTRPGDEIVYTTFGGRLVVMSGDLQILTDYVEPGVVDLVAQSSWQGLMQLGAQQQSSTLPITLMSARGHLATVTLGDGTVPSEPAALLQVASNRYIERPIDVEELTDQGVAVLAGLFFDAHADQLSDQINFIREFDPVTLQAVSADIRPMAGFAGARDMAVLTDTAGEVYYVVVGQTQLYVIKRSQPTQLFRHLVLSDFFGVQNGFAPAIGALSVAVGDVAPRVPGGTELFDDEIVLSTESGHVVWISLDNTQQGSQFVNIPRSYSGLDPVTPHTNRAAVATWGMLAFEEEGQKWLEVVDQTGSRWRVRPDGAMEFVGELEGGVAVAAPGSANLNTPYRYGPIRALVFCGSTPSANASAMPDYDSLSLATNDAVLRTFPWVPDIGFGDPGQANNWLQTTTNGPTYGYVPTYQVLDDQFMALPLAGDYLPDPSGTPGLGEVHWWTGQAAINSYRNLIGGAYLTSTSMTGAWFSSGPNGAHNDANDLRNGTTLVHAHDLQSLRLVHDGTETLIVASAMGGSLIVMRPGDPNGTGNARYGTRLAESRDFGTGGMALAAAYDVMESGAVDIFFGPAVHFANSAPYRATPPVPDDQVGSVHWLRYSSSAPSTIAEIGSPVVLDTASGEPGGYCVSGIAIGNLIGDCCPELVVTTLNGDLFLYALSSSGIVTPPLQRMQLEGSLGAYNSIVIDDLDPGVAGNELYVAGSQGIWKLIVNEG